MSSSPFHLDLTLSGELEQLIQSAAAVRGQSLEGFVLDAAAETSRRVLSGESLTVLSARDRDRFCEFLEHPPEPNAALRLAAERNGSRP